MMINPIVGYTFRADIYCPDCIVDVVTDDPRFDGWKLAPGISMTTEDNLSEIADAFGFNRNDEYSFDSDDFPKDILVWMLDGNEPDVCGKCERPIR